MSKSSINKGETLTWTAPTGGVVSGTAYLAGTILVVALATASAAESVAVATEGVHAIKKKSTDVVTFGARLYWNNTNKELTTSSTGNTLAGYAAAAAGNGDTSVWIKINASS